MTDWRPAVEKHKGPFFRFGLRQDNCLYLESKSLKKLPFLSVYFIANHWFVFHFQTSALSFSTASMYFLTYDIFHPFVFTSAHAGINLASGLLGKPMAVVAVTKVSEGSSRDLSTFLLKCSDSKQLLQ